MEIYYCIVILASVIKAKNPTAFIIFRANIYVYALIIFISILLVGDEDVFDLTDYASI